MTITKPDLGSIRSVGEINKSITRRDFLNGVAIGAGGLMLQACGSDKRLSAIVTTQAPVQFSPPGIDEYYPPTLTGMRGSHDGSYEVAHALAWRGEKPEKYTALDEHYDLVVVGAGMSGLAAAWYYREKMGPEARILILDNHDDFGGHANALAHRWMRVNGLANVDGVCTHFDRQGHLTDHVPRMRADHAAAQDLAVAVRFGAVIKQEFGNAFVATIGNGAA